MGMRSRTSKGATNSANRTSGGWLWPLALTLTGVILLLDNFLLLGEFNAIALLPLVLVMVGAQILLRGDFLPSEDMRRFGITRGSVESATLEINSAEIDVDVRALQTDWRLRDGQPALIAGQFAALSRPQLIMAEQYAHLRLDRAATPWSSFVDWQVGLARDLPWQVLASAHLGQLTLDLSGLIVHEVVASTGIGDLHLTSPAEAFQPLRLRSAFGNIHVVTPPGCHTRIRLQTTRFFSVRADAARYTSPEPNLYVALDAEADAPMIDIQISGTFGDAYLA